MSDLTITHGIYSMLPGLCHNILSVVIGIKKTQKKQKKVYLKYSIVPSSFALYRLVELIGLSD